MNVKTVEKYKIYKSSQHLYFLMKEIFLYALYCKTAVIAMAMVILTVYFKEDAVCSDVLNNKNDNDCKVLYY